MMYDDEYGDDDTRRARRDAQVAALDPQRQSSSAAWREREFDPSDPPADPPWWDQPEPPPQGPWNDPAPTAPPPVPAQPVKEATADENTRMFNPPAPAPNNQPTFQPPSTPSSYRPPTASATPTPGVQPPAITSELMKILTDRLNALKDPYAVKDDPIYQQQSEAYRVGQTRNARNERKQAAERSAAGGQLTSGGFNARVRQIGERQGENVLKYEGDLMHSRLGERENQLNIAIQVARALGQDQVAMELENRRLALSEELGRGDLSLRRDLGYDNLGFNYANLANGMNRDAVLAALGG